MDNGKPSVRNTGYILVSLTNLHGLKHNSVYWQPQAIMKAGLMFQKLIDWFNNHKVYRKFYIYLSYFSSSVLIVHLISISKHSSLNMTGRFSCNLLILWVKGLWQCAKKYEPWNEIPRWKALLQSYTGLKLFFLI